MDRGGTAQVKWMERRVGSGSGNVVVAIGQGVGGWERELGCVRAGGVMFLRTLSAKGEIACFPLKEVPSSSQFST